MKQLHKVAFFVRSELIVGPEGIIEGEISEFLVIAFVEEPGSGSDHIDTKLTVKGDFSLVEGSYSDTNFYTHFQIKTLWNFIIPLKISLTCFF